MMYSFLKYVVRLNTVLLKLYQNLSYLGCKRKLSDENLSAVELF